MAKIIDKNDKVKAPELPAAGYKRTEELAKRKDEIDQQIDELSQNVVGVDPSLIEEDREIQYQLHNNHMEIDLGPGYAVYWVNFKSHNGSQAWAAKAKGWVPVTKDMLKSPCDPMLVSADNYLRVGDVMAMAMPIRRYEALKKQKMEKLAKRGGTFTNELRDISRKTGAFNVYGEGDSNPYAKNIMQRAARNTAVQHLGNQLKAGTVPGVPIR